MIQIPKIIHRVWLGPKEMPDEFKRYGQTWADLHPGWEMKLWTEDNLPNYFQHTALMKTTTVPAWQANIVRYNAVYYFGGIYVDTDFECLKSLEPLLDGIGAFASRFREKSKALANGLFGATAGHAWMKEVLRRVPLVWEPKRTTVGPLLLTQVTKGRQDVTLLPWQHFYPYYSEEMHRKFERFPDAYAVHHWAGSWVPAQEAFLKEKRP